MVSKYSDNLWAEEMGIDLDDLVKESPTHIDQVREARRLAKKAAEYWARERYLARMESPALEATYTPPKRVKSAKKPAKVNRYEFTETQLEIALRSLNARGSV
jgi:pyruvate/2-oxoglutarate dehydrogenase complex dihydrolipoamide acyltransferase (E2) component